MNSNTIPPNIQVAGPFKTIVVQPGTYLGEICPMRPLSDPLVKTCDTSIYDKDDGDFGHAAVQLSVKPDAQANPEANISEIESIISPTCIYDKFQNRVPPNAEQDLQNYRSALQTCPLDIDQY